MTASDRSTWLRRKGALATCFLAVTLGTVGAAPPAQQFFDAVYDIEDLGTISGNAFARAVNNSGQVAGFAFNGPTCCAQAYVFTPPGPAQYRPIISYGNGLNDGGVLVGDRAIPPIGGGAYQAFRLINNVEDLVPLLSGYPYSQGLSINNRNEVAGDAYDLTGRRAFLNTQNGTEDLGTLGGSSYARGINDSTEVVGYSPPRTYVVHSDPYWELGHAFYWSRRTGMLDLNGLTSGLGTAGVNGFELTKASAINSHHRIIGFASSTDLNVIRAFLLEPSGAAPAYWFQQLGTFPNGGISYALGMNRGWATVGAAYLDPSGIGNYRAALFNAGQVVNLNEKIGFFLQGLWTLREASGINDHGQIVGWGEYNGQIHAFKLTPRANLTVVTAEPGRSGTYLLGVEGAGFRPGGQVGVDVRVGDIGGQLVKSGVRTASSTGGLLFGATVPCNTRLVINAWDSTGGAFSNAVNARIPCQ